MSDTIHLLPDHIANQIAAGEVIQRPASAVKELMENAVDAGATQIRLIVNDAGKALIQVIDNGKGMSVGDAQNAFARHATSKISTIEDLFQIRTMGFRGEALASIAAVAQVSLKTKRAEDELGTLVEIENSKVIECNSVAHENGTSISMKNLFFNVPARRNFLKSNSAELKHIIEEFTRVALSFPEILFTLSSNGQDVYHWEGGSFKQRAIQVLGNQYQTKLVAVGEQTDYLTVSGFVGKPETARKTRSDQYFFVNRRFIKSAYLHHAVANAFEGLLPKDSYPSYILYIDVDPSQIDINVHPTKQEIKFEDDKIIYAFVQAAVKHALAQFSIAPSLDFSLDADIQQLDAIQKPFTADKIQGATSHSLYAGFTQKNQAHFIPKSEKGGNSDLENFFTTIPSSNSQANEMGEMQVSPDSYIVKSSSMGLYKEEEGLSVIEDAVLLQLHHTYIIAPTQSGCIILHQQLAHERVLYEKYQKASIQAHATQKSLFPVVLELNPSDAILLDEMLEDLAIIGYEIESFGNNSFIIQGIPADILSGNEKNAIELLLEQFKHFSGEVKYSKREKLIRCMSRQMAIKAGQSLTQKEMHSIIEMLSQCDIPNVTASGAPTYVEFKEGYLDGLFSR
ncbi:MAG: DNA mismatch repair endonuclease MutL [Bacteroidetes bacterium]|nr:DNA mismatch repair endonuclease MutL [Bacteroidota bacterium]